MFQIKGSCHCENIRVTINLAKSPQSYALRACDCDFCVKHGASYLSDPDGSLDIEVADEKMVGHYRQGSKTADFIFCVQCGVLVGVSYQKDDRIFMGINGKIILDIKFKETLNVSPKKLAPEERVKRWNDVWFSRVNFL